MLGAVLASVVVCAALGAAWWRRRGRSDEERLTALVELEARRNDRLTTFARSVSASNHVLANATMAAMLQLELLERRLRGSTDEETDLSANAARAMHDLRRCHALVNEVKLALVAVSPAQDPFDWRPVVARTCERHRAVLSIAEGAAHPVALEGGAARLEEMLDALLRNAWEGDGARGARAVEVDVRCAGSDPRELVVVVRDDGPGFAADVLAELPKPCWSTKGRVGLSLFETARSALASGGSLRVSNGVSGGARVELSLRGVILSRAE